MQIKAPKHSVIVTAMAWTRYLNEKRKLASQSTYILADTASELDAMWAIGQVENANVKDPYTQENLVKDSHILFLIAGACPLDGTRTGRIGTYVAHSHFITGYFDPGEISPTVKELADLQDMAHEATSPSNGHQLHHEQLPSAAQSSILVARTVIDGAFSDLP